MAATEFPYDTILGIVGLFVGIVGIVVAVQALRLALKTDSKVNTTLTKVEDVAVQLDSAVKRFQQALSTRSIGQFPDFVDEIIEVLRPATSIMVFCDLPAYAVFSNPEASKRYSEFLIDRVNESKRLDSGLTVAIKCLTEDRRGEFLADQFPLPAWSTVSVAALARFRRDHPFDDLAGGPGPDTRDEFLTRLRRVQNRAYEELREIAVPVDEIMPLYFWIAGGEHDDNPAAVFALAGFRDGGREVAFSTRDERLIDAMRGIYKEYPPAAKA